MEDAQTQEENVMEKIVLERADKFYDRLKVEEQEILDQAVEEICKHMIFRGTLPEHGKIEVIILAAHLLLLVERFPATDAEVEEFLSDPANKAELPESLKDPLKIIELAERRRGRECPDLIGKANGKYLCEADKGKLPIPCVVMHEGLPCPFGKKKNKGGGGDESKN